MKRKENETETAQGHTPGPWKMVEDVNGFLWVEAKGPIILAKIHSMASEVKDKANARLIASAPDLLEALKEATMAFKFLDSNRLKTQGVTKQLDLLIARAEGRTP